jgi:hypothetical protein
MSNNICQECGMIVEPMEFHPYEFCVLHKHGQDPRKSYTSELSNVIKPNYSASGRRWRKSNSNLHIRVTLTP